MISWGYVKMLKACSKCGGVHEKSYVCGSGILQKRNSEADSFRNTRRWRRKAEEIRKRDCNLCRICFEGLYNTRLRFNSEKLSVHHITPIAEDFDKRLESNNLITLCQYHHELAEKGTIPRRLLRELAAGRQDFSRIK